MPPADDHGPDGSSIKPVSSLRAKFENLQTQAADQPAAPPPAAPPKLDRLRDGASTPSSGREPPPVPRNKPKPPLKLPGLQTQLAPDGGPPSPFRQPLAPPLSPKPLHPPSLLVEPPQSPPKPRPQTLALDQTSLNPESAVKPTSPATFSKHFRIPSRPHTPTLEPRRSPRLGGSPKPPSPPPPRRSAELRRERDVRSTAAGTVTVAGAPPLSPRPRPEKAPRSPFLDAKELGLGTVPEKMSPFNSPPSSNSSADGDTPPVLPQRPRPQAQAQAPGPAPAPAALPHPTQTMPNGFEPPPLHHSLANKRRERDIQPSASPRGTLTPQSTGEQRPALPARPLSMAILPAARNEIPTFMPPPPRPSRPAANGNTYQPEASMSGSYQKRVVSTPATQSSLAASRPLGRSMTVDRGLRRPANNPRSTSPGIQGHSDPHRGASTALVVSNPEQAVQGSSTGFPDATNTNRRPPYIKQGVHEITTKYDPRNFAVCGDLVCASGQFTRVWSLLDGELLMSLAHGEGIRATAVAFKPGADVRGEGARLWIGNNFGELMEADIATKSIVASKQGAHGRSEIVRIHRHFNELWTLDENGTLHVWGPDEAGVSNLDGNPTMSHRIPKGHTFSIVVGDELWHATGKEIRVFLPTPDHRAQFQLLMRPLVQDSAGDVSAGTLTTTDPDRVIFGHSDGKVSIYNSKDYSCLGVIGLSSYKINAMAAAGMHVWTGNSGGRICVYDTSEKLWTVRKDWQAHDTAVINLIADRSGGYKLSRSQVLSLGADNLIKVWDGLLQDDWLEDEMRKREPNFCGFETIKALVLTWNAGASTPNSLRYSDRDAEFIQKLLHESDHPDILVFGFQELVDLEDKAATAKRFLKSKKKEGSDQERMSHQYRDWRDFLVRSLDDYMPDSLYHLLQTSTLVGLFTCIFVKADLRARISNLSTGDIKRGMGGLHGNKGAIAVRFMVDDTSLCFVNCHLAAGQSQANHRHNDIAAILEANMLPVERDTNVRLDSYPGGGDGSMILDHELCVINGDLNYRIDTMSRDTVVAAVKAGNLSKLLERDQLLVARRRNAAFRLRAFEEMPIRFAPTYKYDVGTDNYDTSEKKRSPAWCDRILHRGGVGKRIEQLDYRRHEVRVSDHRPVTAKFRFKVKKISPKRRAVAWMEAQQSWEDVKAMEMETEKLYYLSHVIGYDEATSRKLIRKKEGASRSPSRHRD